MGQVLESFRKLKVKQKRKNMKKLIFTALAAMSSTIFASTRTAEEYRSIAAQMIAAQDNKDRAAIAQSNQFWRITWRKDLADTRLELDSALADVGFCDRAMIAYYNIKWPRLSAIERSARGIDRVMPVTCRMAEKYNSDMLAVFLTKNITSIDDYVLCMDECLRVFITCDNASLACDNDIQLYKTGLQRMAERAVRRMLRHSGKSFVTKDGVNPCAVYMERLNAALNAPRLEGLSDWLSEVGVATVDLSYLPSVSKVEELKESILDGDVQMNEKNRRTLLICLGVDAYNAFVREYNGE